VTRSLFPLVALAASLLIAVTRWPFQTTYLYGFDNANLALALDWFSPYEHRPQPPGYPLFVLLCWLLHFLIPDAHHAQLAAGFLCAGSALVFAWLLGRSVAGPWAGWAAAGFLFCHPALWLATTANPLRTPLALGSLALAYFCWRSLESRSSRWFVAAAVAWAVLGGFRPETLPLLFPLLAYTWWRSGIGFRAALPATAAASLIVAAWTAAIILASGGWAATLEMFRDYSNQYSAYSPLRGARGPVVWQHAWLAVRWQFSLGLFLIPAWIYLGLRLRKVNLTWIAFLLVWVVPGALFYCFVHLDFPDPALANIAALCVVAGATAAALAHYVPFGRFAVPLLVLAAMALETRLFFRPSRRWDAESGYARMLRESEQTNAPTHRALAARNRNQSVIVCWACSPTWRILSYYHPKTRFLIPHAAPDSAEPNPSAWTIVANQNTQPDPPNGTFRFPAGTELIWLIDPAVRQRLSHTPDADWTSPLPSTTITPADSIRFGPYTVAAR
jgi:hypothetical protein